MTPKEARKLELACGLLKAAVFMSCAAGFTYQVVEFALHFWTYPTNINLEVTHPGKIHGSRIHLLQPQPVAALSPSPRFLGELSKSLLLLVPYTPGAEDPVLCQVSGQMRTP
ncbi:hypothetical protein CEXT_448621 [Caerostris extrusa]|uniref:Uncharacterized protein n=1 Tax=Caerostris extrusa TaxID=172846 RepID=A0AAV4UWT8_CAEEX|nr:hypothetical protein CEXT_448621 [Caerostris extrusa]